MYRYKDIVFRPIEKLDLSFLREMHNDYLTVKYLTNAHMVNEIEQECWYQDICLSKTSMRFVVIYKDNKVGCMRFDNYDSVNRNIQIGGDIHVDFRGKGLGKMMFEACLHYSFEVLNCHRVYLCTLETNKVAINMYHQCGMIAEGISTESIYRNGQYSNCINMYMTDNIYYNKEMK